MKQIFLYIGRFLAIFSLMILFQRLALITIPPNALLYFPSIAIATIVMLYLFDSKKRLNLGIIQPQSFLSHGKGFLLGILLISLVFVSIWFVGAIQIQTILFSNEQFTSLIALTILFFIVSFQEELLYRGYLYALADHLFQRSIVSLLATSFLFSISHIFNPNVLTNPIPLTNIFLAGILLGILRQYSSGIWMPIGFHWSWNLFQGGVYGFHVSGLSIKSVMQIETTQNVWLSGGDFGAEGSIITTTLFLILIIGIYIYYQKTTQSKQGRS